MNENVKSLMSLLAFYVVILSTAIGKVLKFSNYDCKTAYI